MYKFKKVSDPQNRFDNVEIEHSADVVTASDLAEAFYFFAVGCGYASESVLSGMEGVIEQYTREEKIEPCCSKGYDCMCEVEDE